MTIERKVFWGWLTIVVLFIAAAMMIGSACGDCFVQVDGYREPSLLGK